MNGVAVGGSQLWQAHHMPTPRLSKSKLRRSPSKRAVVLVYCSPEEKARLEAAAAELVKEIPGAKMPLSSWLLSLGLGAADDLERRP